MANEIKMTVQLTYENGQLKYTYQPGTMQMPQAAQGMLNQTVTINTTASETVSVAALGVPGLTIMQSMEATTTGNYITYGMATSTGGVQLNNKLTAKSIAVLRYASSTASLRAQANTAAVNVQFVTFEA